MRLHGRITELLKALRTDYSCVEWLVVLVRSAQGGLGHNHSQNINNGVSQIQQIVDNEVKQKPTIDP